MTAAYEWVARASVWWWPRFADHLWQTTVFALVILAAVLVLRRGPAHLRHTFCLLASAKFVIPAAVFVFLAQQAGIDPPSFLRVAQETDQNAAILYGITEPVATLSSTYEVTVVATEAIRHNEVYLALTVVWLLGSLTILLFSAIRRRKFLRSLSLGKTIHQGREWQAFERAQEVLHLKTRVGLVISPLKIEPAVWRVWRPIVVVPDSITSHLDDDELDAIMLHELVHIQRRDNLIGNLQLALCALLWFHPLIWFISRKLFEEREQACDERVMEVCRTPEAYASSILKVVRFCVGWRVAGVIGAASGSNLRRRIENIMSNGNTKRRGSGASRLLAGTLVGIALLILAGAGIYSRPRAVSAAAKETAENRVGNGPESPDGQPGSVGNDSMAPEPLAAVDRKSSRKTKQQPPPPPPAAPNDAAPPAPPSAPSTSSPASPASPSSPVSPASPASQPTQPAQPTEPAVKQDKAGKPAKDKSSKESKEKAVKGELIEAPPPVYPEEAKKQKIEGAVVVAIVIGHEGNVISAKAKSGPEALYGASEQAASKARFKPTYKDGAPVKVYGHMTYNFVLDKK